MNRNTENVDKKKNRHFLYYIFQLDRKKTIFPDIMIKDKKYKTKKLDD